MKRFLVLQTIVLANHRAATKMEEPVIDFDTFEEADDWVNQQGNPALYRVEDQFPEDDLAPDYDQDMFIESEFDANNDLFDDSHYFGHYESRYFRDEDLFEQDEDDAHDGDGDAD